MLSNSDLFIGAINLLLPSIIILLGISLHFNQLRKRCSQESDEQLIGFFHPLCSAGGGGERVLWKQIEALGDLKDKGFKIRVVVYTSDHECDKYKNGLLHQVKKRFSIEINPNLPLRFIHIPSRKDSSTFKRFTLVAESLHTMKLAWCALNKVTPHIFIDTTGCAFTFVIAKMALCRIVAYVHYPTISMDMLHIVWNKRPTYNNASEISGNNMKTCSKLIYYILFAILYGLVGSLATLIFTNSTWTDNHISHLWRLKRKRTHILYPPVQIDSLQNFPVDPKKRSPTVLSIGQFRPEKDHALQIRAFARLLDEPKIDHIRHRLKLILIGSCRGEDDKKRVAGLRHLVNSLKINSSVEFVLNQPFSVLTDHLSKASVGLHTMWNEHFGIGIVEMMASGLITIAHNSGGPRSDIIIPYGKDSQKVGYLASSEDEYVKFMLEALTGLSYKENERIRISAKKSSQRFSDRVFTDAFKHYILSILKE